MKFNYFVGIDVSKKTFDISIKGIGDSYSHVQYPNDRKGLRTFLKHLKGKEITLSECLVCLEHTGIYAHLLLEVMYEKGIHIWLEHALSIKRSLGLRRGKNDKVDAQRIAEYAFRFNDKCTLWRPSRKEINKLKNLLSLRLRLIKVKKSIKAPLIEAVDIKSKEFKDIQLLTLPVIKKIEKQLELLEEQIESLIKSDSHLFRLAEIITSVDGVGKVTAWNMIVCTNEFQDFTSSRKFSCYSGVVPFDHSSGTSVYSKPRVSRMANKKMKELLHMSALSSTVMKGELNDYYIRKVKEGKNKMLVLNNIRNKLVHRIFACVQENRKYEKSYTSPLV